VPPKDPADDESLKRLGGGRWQTRDERFTIVPQSGTWVVVDAEQTDDLGMALVRGPFGSLTAAKAAIATARTSEPATSSLAGRLAAGGEGRAAAKPAKPTKPTTSTTDEAGGPSGDIARSSAERRAAPAPARAPAPDVEVPRRKPTSAEPPAEPGWIGDLGAAERGRARRLIAALSEAGVSDAEGIVRRDLVGDVPALAAVAIGRRLAGLGDEATPGAVADVMAEGRDDRLGVRWRLVDGDGRPILLDLPGPKRRR
jgi:hypothetical protein